MSKGALALLITGGTENWAPGRWRERFRRVCPERPVALVPDDSVDPESVRYAAVWKPKPGMLGGFPKLEVIFNLGAGVDAVVASSHACANAVRVADGVPLVSYCHTPMRYAWDFTAESSRFPSVVKCPAIVPIRSWSWRPSSLISCAFRAICSCRQP